MFFIHARVGCCSSCSSWIVPLKLKPTQTYTHSYHNLIFNSLFFIYFLKIIIFFTLHPGLSKRSHVPEFMFLVICLVLCILVFMYFIYILYKLHFFCYNFIIRRYNKNKRPDKKLNSRKKCFFLYYYYYILKISSNNLGQVNMISSRSLKLECQFSGLFQRPTKNKLAKILFMNNQNDKSHFRKDQCQDFIFMNNHLLSLEINIKFSMKRL